MASKETICPGFPGLDKWPRTQDFRTNTRTAPGKLGRVDQPSGSMPLRDAKWFAHPWELSPLLKDLSLPTHTCRAMGRMKSTYRGDHVPLLFGLSPLISTMQMFEQAQEAEKILYCIVKIQARITATLLS